MKKNTAMQTEFSSALSTMEDLCAKATSISGAAKKKSDQAIEEMNKKKGVGWNVKESDIVIKSKVDNKATTRRERLDGKDIRKPVVKVDNPMLAAVLEHGANQDLGEREQPIEIRHFGCPSKWQGIQGANWGSSNSKAPCSMCYVLPPDILI